MVELRTFIRKTLIQVIEGIQEAQKESQETSAIINPSNTSMKQQVRHPDSGNNYSIQELHFDIAVTTTDKEGKSGGIGIFVSSLGIGGKKEIQASQITENRIQFSVPIVFPEPSQKPYPAPYIREQSGKPIKT
jgi:hypothetical protein